MRSENEEMEFLCFGDLFESVDRVVLESMDAERVESVLESTKESSCKSACMRPVCCLGGFVIIAKCYSIGLALEEKN